MPLGLKPACYKCESTNSEIWHKTKEGNTVCNTCFGIIKPVAVPKPEPVVKPPEKVVQTDTNTAEEINIETMDVEENLAEEAVEDIKPRNEGGLGTRSGNSASGRGGKTGTRKSRGRSKKLGTVSKTTVAKGRGRRAVFKKQPPIKAPSSFATTITTERLFHKDMYYQVGDIISVVDHDDGIYYAQIRGLLQDQFCEKSAVLTWLIPTQSSPSPGEGFDPLTYILGPEEELPRKLDYLDFVMHAPNEYYKLDDKVRISKEREAGFIWTSMGAVRRTIHV